MLGDFQFIEISKVELDKDNPRIAIMMELLKDKASPEAIALALGSGSSETAGTTYHGLKESIRASRGIIHPIVVNRKPDGKYVVIEGNTRVQIYQEFLENDVPGNWSTIKAIVHEDMKAADIHAIRLQSHLVGPREWDPYSKAKYLHTLYNEDHLPVSMIVSYCGGNPRRIESMIQAYEDMEKYYRPALRDDSSFDQKKFSFFEEMQSKRIIETILYNDFDKDDFARWVINRNIETAQSVRKLPQILNHSGARRVFLKQNISEALKLVEKPDDSLKDATIVQLSNELTQKLNELPFQKLERMGDEANYEKLVSLRDLKDVLDNILEIIDKSEA